MIDPNICGDNGPITPEQCALWLDAKYSRHGELEDHAAALWLRKLSIQLGSAQLEIGIRPMNEKERLERMVLALVASKFNVYLPPNRPAMRADFDNAFDHAKWNDTAMRETVRCAQTLLAAIDSVN